MRRLLPAVLLIAVGLAGGAARAGTIAGQVYTAENADSLAKGCAVTLIYRVAGGDLQRTETTTDDPPVMIQPCITAAAGPCTIEQKDS